MNNTSFATSNIIHSVIDKSKRIIYDPSHSLFDYIMNDLDMGVHYDDNVFTLHYSYDAYVSNNFLTHSTNRNRLNAYHLNDIVFIHETLNPKFKKEDRVILNNNLKNTYKILLHDSLNSTWQYFDNKITINYGIPTPTVDLNKQRDDILIINLKKSNQLNLIYQHLKNIFPKTMMLTEIGEDWSNIYDTFSSYKIVIEENSIFHQLIAAYCGCIIISPHIHFDKKIEGYFNIENFGSIFNSIESILKSYNVSNFTNQIDHIKNTYELENFKIKISTIIQTMKERVFVL